MSARTPDRAGDGAAHPQPESQQPAPSGDRMGATITAYMVTGPVLYALLGWLADRWLGTGFLLPVGLLAGMALSLYVVWLRYGKP